MHIYFAIINVLLSLVKSITDEKSSLLNRTINQVAFLLQLWGVLLEKVERFGVIDLFTSTPVGIRNEMKVVQT